MCQIYFTIGTAHGWHSKNEIIPKFAIRGKILSSKVITNKIRNIGISSQILAN